jgi:hypothetical protein
MHSVVGMLGFHMQSSPVSKKALYSLGIDSQIHRVTIESSLYIFATQFFAGLQVDVVAKYFLHYSNFLLSIEWFLTFSMTASDGRLFFCEERQVQNIQCNHRDDSHQHNSGKNISCVINLRSSVLYLFTYCPSRGIS